MISYQRIKKNYRSIPHKKLTFDEHIDRISLKLEKIQSLYSMAIISNKNEKINKKISNLLEICQSHEFIVAFVGVIKTGKSTLINSLLGHEYASWAVDPETAALTKFKYSPENYITVKFYNMVEWEEFWKDTEKSPHFRNEYTNMDGNSFKKKFIGHVNAGYSCGLDFSPDGQFLCSGDADGKLWFWDWRTTKNYTTINAHNKICNDVKWHPIKPSLLASCSWDNTIKLWDSR